MKLLGSLSVFPILPERLNRLHDLSTQSLVVMVTRGAGTIRSHIARPLGADRTQSCQTPARVFRPNACRHWRQAPNSVLPTTPSSLISTHTYSTKTLGSAALMAIAKMRVSPIFQLNSVYMNPYRSIQVVLASLLGTIANPQATSDFPLWALVFSIRKAISGNASHEEGDQQAIYNQTRFRRSARSPCSGRQRQRSHDQCVAARKKYLRQSLAHSGRAHPHLPA